MARDRGKRQINPNEEAYLAACRRVAGHPLFRPFIGFGGPGVRFDWREDADLASRRGWARVGGDGSIVANPGQRATEEEWLWVLTHCLLHLGFGHLQRDRAGPFDHAHDAAACVAVTRFQQHLKLGVPPVSVRRPLPATDEAVLAARWRDTAVPEEYAGCGVGGQGTDLARRPVPPQGDPSGRPTAGPRALTWPDRFAMGLAAAATAAVEAAGTPRSESGRLDPNSPWELARRWFLSSYPLLGGLAAGFRIVADVELIRSWQISVAAVDASVAEIYVNPMLRLAEPECRFVLAHEMLHAALRHGDRVAHRDPYLWNVAADFVVNGWLVEMAVGELPEGCLYDPELRGMSAEAVYDRIARDLRRYRKLATLRGVGRSDILGPGSPGPGQPGGSVDLDDYYRRALTTGLAFHVSAGRGLLPSGLVAEIRVLDQPPLPWDARLARWFDEHFPAVQPQRSYARASRRQAATPDIPRPGRVHPQERIQRPTFGVVLDTSGSMNAQLLGKALGAIASYSLAHDVPAARVVFCDAAAYDAGYLPVEQIAGRVKVRGRGGTVLQPGVNLLERADDFPADGPILVITDARCDVLRIRREHAFLVPEGARLPFTPRGPVFRLR